MRILREYLGTGKLSFDGDKDTYDLSYLMLSRVRILYLNAVVLDSGLYEKIDLGLDLMRKLTQSEEYKQGWNALVYMAKKLEELHAKHFGSRSLENLKIAMAIKTAIAISFSSTIFNRAISRNKQISEFETNSNFISFFSRVYTDFVVVEQHLDDLRKAINEKDSKLYEIIIENGQNKESVFWKTLGRLDYSIRVPLLCGLNAINTGETTTVGFGVDLGKVELFKAMGSPSNGKKKEFIN